MWLPETGSGHGRKRAIHHEIHSNGVWASFGRESSHSPMSRASPSPRSQVEVTWMLDDGAVPAGRHVQPKACPAESLDVCGVMQYSVFPGLGKKHWTRAEDSSPLRECMEEGLNVANTEAHYTMRDRPNRSLRAGCCGQDSMQAQGCLNSQAASSRPHKPSFADEELQTRGLQRRGIRGWAFDSCPSGLSGIAPYMTDHDKEELQAREEPRIQRKSWQSSNAMRSVLSQPELAQRKRSCADSPDPKAVFHASQRCPLPSQVSQVLPGSLSTELSDVQERLERLQRTHAELGEVYAGRPSAGDGIYLGFQHYTGEKPRGSAVSTREPSPAVAGRASPVPKDFYANHQKLFHPKKEADPGYGIRCGKSCRSQRRNSYASPLAHQASEDGNSPVRPARHYPAFPASPSSPSSSDPSDTAHRRLPPAGYPTWMRVDRSDAELQCEVASGRRPMSARRTSRSPQSARPDSTGARAAGGRASNSPFAYHGRRRSPNGASEVAKESMMEHTSLSPLPPRSSMLGPRHDVSSEVWQSDRWSGRNLSPRPTGRPLSTSPRTQDIPQVAGLARRRSRRDLELSEPWTDIWQHSRDPKEFDKPVVYTGKSSLAAVAKDNLRMCFQGTPGAWLYE